MGSVRFLVGSIACGIAFVGCDSSRSGRDVSSEARAANSPPRGIVQGDRSRSEESTHAQSVNELGAQSSTAVSMRVGDAEFVASGGRDSSSGTNFIAIRVRRAESGMREIARLPLASWQSPPPLRWLPSRPGENPQLLVSFEESGDGNTGSAVYRLTERTAVLVFSDAGDACRPASVVDLEDDGVAELASYRAPRNHCERLCVSGLRDLRLGEPTWTTVLAWDGRKWTENHSNARAFYDSVAGVYRELRAAMPTLDPLLNCADVAGTELSRDLDAWSARALELSRSKR
jgi:hypothetical protein